MLPDKRCATVALAGFLLLPLAASRGVPPARDLPAPRQAKEDSPRSPSDEEATKKHRADRLAEMRRRAEGTKVFQFVDGDRVACEMHPEPVLRYDWQVGGVPDGTLWIWVNEVRPAAALKVQIHPRNNQARCLYEMYSLSSRLIEVEFDEAPSWSSREPGLEFEPLPEGPRPSDNEAVRLAQMKQIHRQFSFYQVSFRGRTEHRHLPRPLYRYADLDSGLQDAALFVSSSAGTCPDIICLIELRHAEGEASAWHYAFQHSANADAHALLGGKEVWKVTGRGWRAAPTGGDTWQMYWASTPVDPSLLDDGEPSNKEE